MKYLPLMYIALLTIGCVKKQPPPIEATTSKTAAVDTSMTAPAQKLVVDVVTIDTARIQPPEGSPTSRSTNGQTEIAKEPLHQLQIKDNTGKMLREFNPTDFKALNLSALRWLNDQELLFISSGLFDVSGFWIYQVPQNKVLPVEYDQGMAIFEASQTHKTLEWTMRNDSVVGFVAR
ncbi:MAG: hypothetical protein JNM36_08710 [Chitinophagales bacterium]|nr:hypothetical protein [Chitinophagales bacterium]